MPAGPLVRVEGQSVSIRCDVSDYEGPPEQDFEWSLVLSQQPVVPLISTFDQTFTDQSMMDRVKSGDISIKKLADDAAELTIRKVRASDSATYRCSTPSTDSSFKGNYYADVELKGGLLLYHETKSNGGNYAIIKKRPIKTKLEKKVKANLIRKYIHMSLFFQL